MKIPYIINRKSIFPYRKHSTHINKTSYLETMTVQSNLMCMVLDCTRTPFNHSITQPSNNADCMERSPEERTTCWRVTGTKAHLQIWTRHLRVTSAHCSVAPSFKNHIALKHFWVHTPWVARACLCALTPPPTSRTPHLAYDPQAGRHSWSQRCTRCHLEQENLTLLWFLQTQSD